jgi:hypothetical protein
MITTQPNPESLKYRLGQKIYWQDETGEYKEGTVINISFYGVDVTSGWQEYQVMFDQIVG